MNSYKIIADGSIRNGQMGIGVSVQKDGLGFDKIAERVHVMNNDAANPEVESLIAAMKWVLANTNGDDEIVLYNDNKTIVENLQRFKFPSKTFKMVVNKKLAVNLYAECVCLRDFKLKWASRDNSASAHELAYSKLIDMNVLKS